MDVANLREELAKLRGKVDKDLENVRLYRELVGNAERQAATTIEEYGARMKAVKSLQKQVAIAEKTAQVKRDSEWLNQVKALKEELQALQSRVKTVKEICPSTGSLFVRLFLGRVNVRVQERKDQTKLRDEYNKFKDRANKIFLAIPLIIVSIQYFLSDTYYAPKYTEWMMVLAHVWLMYYYVSLSLRENILRVNGSAIRPWWIYHHYLSALMSVVMLTWPRTETYNRFSSHFTSYFIYQGFVQLLQAWYQKRRHYALRSLGRVSSMDVQSSETLTEMHGGLYLVLVFVGVAQAFQAYNGYLLLVAFWELDKSSHWWNYREEIQILILGVSFILLAVCNFWNTAATVLEKRRKMRPSDAPVSGMKRSASRPVFDPQAGPKKDL